MSEAPVTPPAATVVPPVTPPAATPSPVTPEATKQWFDGASAENAGWIQNKGYKNNLDLIDAARNMEKLIGLPAERIIKTPEKMRDENGQLTADGRAIFESFFDAPKEAKDYDIEIPKEGADPKQAELFRKLFHEEGVPKATAAKLVREWNKYQGDQMAAFKADAEAKGKQADAVLKRDWGNAYEQNVNIAKEAARTLGVDEQTVNAMHHTLGAEKTLKLFHKMGTAVGEGRFVSGGGANALLTPAAAESQISALKNDMEFSKKFSAGDAEAVAKWTKLHQQAYPGQFNVGATYI